MDERLRFTVTQAHIDAALADPRLAEEGGRDCCPVSRALREKTGDQWGVGQYFAQQGPESPPFEWGLSDATRRRIRQFDEGRGMHPFTGELRRRIP